jgi:hypothetical protein
MKMTGIRVSAFVSSRCVALGRKNYPFDGSDADGKRAAAIYSPIETPKLDSIDRRTYLADVIAPSGPSATPAH